MESWTKYSIGLDDLDIIRDIQLKSKEIRDVSIGALIRIFKHARHKNMSKKMHKENKGKYQ